MSPWRRAVGDISPGERLGPWVLPPALPSRQGPASEAGLSRRPRRLRHGPSRALTAQGVQGRAGGGEPRGAPPRRHWGRQPRTPLLPESFLRSSPHARWLRPRHAVPSSGPEVGAEAGDGGQQGCSLRASWGRPHLLWLCCPHVASPHTMSRPPPQKSRSRWIQA